MTLPFTREAFLDVFGAYNTSLWPAAAALWAVSLTVVVLALRRPGPAADRRLTLLLVAHWIWAALAYHAAFFTVINPAAWIFSAMFLTQAALFAWFGLRGSLRFDRRQSWQTVVATVLVAYAFLYPGIVMLGGLTPPRAPTFGVPCPTTLLTAGLLMMASRPASALLAIPLAWMVIAGSAAWMLGVHADFALWPSAILLIGARMTRRYDAALA